MLTIATPNVVAPCGTRHCKDSICPLPVQSYSKEKMHLSHLILSEFRNYRQLELSLEPGLFLFHGDNAQGKTNLLEAVAMLATATSFHAAGDREVVNWYGPEHIAHLKGTVKRCEDDVDIEMMIFDPAPPMMQDTTQRTHTIELPATTPRKRFKVNAVPRRTIDLIGQMKVVLFAPTDLNLVAGSPDERRRFLDRTLCQVKPRYCQALVKYRKVVTQRSALLKRIRDNQEDPHMLDYLDGQLASLGNLIIFERQRMTDALNQRATSFQQSISGGGEQLQIHYRPSFKMEEARSTIESSQYYQAQLREVRRKEILQGVCLLGPHRDDLEFQVNGINMLTYGSRGQQRTVALSTKLAELAYMHISTGDAPILLLDDVFSELDHTRREYLLCQILQHEQVLLTSTDLIGFPENVLNRAHVYHVIDATLQKDA